MAGSSTPADERIRWYRTPIDKELLAELNVRSDLRGWLQTGGYLLVVLTTGTVALYSGFHWPWWVTLALVFGHGTLFCTIQSGMHELIHRTVFKTRWLNDWWAHFFSFFSWVSDVAFHPSHMLHHQHTLHQPDDLEVVLPQKTLEKHFLQFGIVNPKGFVYNFKNALRLARGRFEGEWELKTLPEDQPAKRRAVRRWGQTQLLGHGLIIALSMWLGWARSPVWLLLPVLTTFGPFYGGWLMMLLGTPQHIGLQDAVPDYRLCCRTYTTNRFFQFMYWHMNYHIEHHMYAGVPCYNLRQLHAAMEHDLPPSPHGLVATWKQIFAIMHEQEKDSTYQYVAALPQGTNPTGSV